MKKFFTLFLTLMTSVMLWAYDFQSGDLYYNITSNVAPYTVEVTSGNTKYSGDITIPSSVTYNGITYAVTSIGGWAFYYSSLTSVTIPNSVTSIGTSAFEGCSSLTSVTIPSSVTSIGSYAFSDCSTLTSITIPNSVTSIGHHVFNGCVLPKDKFINNSAYTSNNWGVTLVDKEQNGLLIKDNVVVGAKRDITTATIPNGIVGIGGGAFRHCSSLTSVTIPNSVTSIGYHAFYGCSSLTSVTIPEGVTSIGGGAFEDCSSLTSVTIPNSVTSIGWNAFKNTGIFNDNSNCENGVLYISNCLVDAKESLSGAYTIKNGTRIIADGAFRDCSSLTSVTIPSSVTSIEGGAFMDCKALTNVTISNGVMKIGGEAFRGCPSLTSVFIPSSVTSIGTNPFDGCPGIISIVVDENNPKYDSRNNCNGIIETATNRLITGCQNTIIPYGVTNIDHAFWGCSSLKEITIPNTVTNIGTYTFESCSLTSIVIPKSVTSMGAAFIGCPLSTIVVEEGNPKYDSRNNCNAIIITSTNTLLTGSNNTIIPEGITAISPNAFHGRKQIASIAIPNTVTSIGQYAFNGCTSLTSITIPDGVTVIKTFAFSSCDALTSVIIGKGVNSFEQGAFFHSPVETVYFNAQEPAIGKEMVTGYRYFTTSPTCYIPCGTKAAYEASAWASQVSEFVEEPCEEYTITYTSTDGNIVIPNKADAFGANIVSNTYENGVGTITFDSPVTSIGSGAFLRCSSLTSVTIPKSVETIGLEAFMDCKALTNVTISNGVMKIGGEAFRGCPSLTSVFIPSSVTSMGINPFDACSGITSIVVDENNPKYDSRNNCNGIIETATNRLITGCQNTIIPYGVTNIDHAFWNCSSLKEITIPNTVTNIGTYTFESCSLTSIVIPKSVTSIGDRAFSLCPLSTIVVEEGNPKYDSRNNCNAIIITSTNTLLAGSNNTIIPEGITAISPNAFRGRKHIASIAIPNTVTRIGESAFDGCTSLTSITIPDGVTAIKGFAFAFCDALTSVIIGKGVNRVDEGAFIMSPIETVYFNAQEPAVMDRTGYGQFSSSPTCYIPCGTKAAYEASDWNDYMESFIETYEYTLTLSSSDNSMGSATITQEPACGTPAIIVATPNDGYFFSQWSDGNTDNPRTLTVNEDIELAAEFEEIGDYGFYSRTVRIGYNTICLPHGAIHFTGATFYEIAHILKNKKKIFFDEVKTLEAGKPYIFYPHSTEVTIYYDNTTSTVPLSHNGLHGTFDGITAASNFLKGKYLVAGNRMVLCGDGCSLAANRAYIELDEISDKDHPAIPGIKRVSMDYSEENATTALDNITDESIVAPIQEGVYDILGRKVDAPTVSGFYIINGKKVFIAL